MLVDSISMKTPMNSNIINIISCLEAIFDINYLYPILLDPSGLCLSYLKEAYGLDTILE